MKLKRIMIAAPKSGSGKTLITCALLQTLKNRGFQTVSYKCGPDYIDAMFHEKVIGIPSKNLDTFFTGEKVTKQLFLENRTEKDFAVLEGVMGLFDGLGGIREEGSSYHLGKVTETPMILVIDAKGMGYSVIPLIAGFLAYDSENLIQGVILNRMSGKYYESIGPLIEQELHIKVCGYYPEQRELHIESRHLGLVLPNEMEEIKKQLQTASLELEKTVKIEEIIQIAESACALEACQMTEERGNGSADEPVKERPVIAVARDEAFCFYYEDNLNMLRKKGAEITYFSPIRDRELPKDCDALLIGGGYPELYGEELSSNVSMRRAIKQAADQKMPIVAECGGFMYLHTAILDKTGVSYAMADVIPAVCEDKGRPVRFGYVEIREKESRFLPKGEAIRGHEFHYFDSTDNGEDCLAIKPAADRSYPCVMEGETYWFGFPHLYYPSNPAFVRAFVKKAMAYKNRKESRYAVFPPQSQKEF